MRENFIDDLRMKFLQTEFDKELKFYDYMETILTDFFKEIDHKFLMEQ